MDEHDKEARMAFGPNGEVIAPKAETGPDYVVQGPAKLKRIALASFLCGVTACITVALIGAAAIFIVSTAQAIVGVTNGIFQGGNGLAGGISIALGMSAMNWWFFYFTIPAAWIALGFSIGRMPHRGITRVMPYYRWGAIWGALLVGATTTFFSIVLGSGFTVSSDASQPAFVLGAGLTGMLIGGLAGAICGGLFIAIVRPAEQVRRIEVSVF